MKAGAEPKKIVILASLLAVAAYLLWSNFLGGSRDVPPRAAEPPRVPASVGDVTPPPAAEPPPASRPVRNSRQESGSLEFKPTLKLRERLDPTTADPTLRLELLAKLREVKIEGGERSLFEFSQPRAPKTPEVKILPKPVAEAPKPPSAGGDNPEAKPPKPPPPPIPLKFYGFITSPHEGTKRAFFLEGEEIYVASEGELIKRRYKVVRIGANSAVLEDVEHKNEQTLVLEEQVG